MKKLYLLLLFEIFWMNWAIAQTGNTVKFAPKLNIPTSPEAAMLGKFGEIPVGYYTGTANISIPLYTIEVDGKETPISLEYHSSGLKVAEEATWVGLGWNLAPEGSIIQEVRGRKDQNDDNIARSIDFDQWQIFKNRFLALPLGSFKLIKQIGIDGLDGCPNSNPVWQNQSDLKDDLFLLNSLLALNGQPDIYHYNFGGYSGSFYINPDTRQIVLVDKSEDLVFRVTNGGISVDTPKGERYGFGAIENSNSTLSGGDPYAGVTYKLSSVSYVGGNAVNFVYKLGHQTSKVYAQNAAMNFYCSPAPMPDNVPYFTYNTGEVRILKQILTQKDSINFSTGSRTDIFFPLYGAQDYSGKLESIDIFSRITKQKVKSFTFSYSYFDATPGSSSSTNTKRLRLDSVKEVGYKPDGAQDLSKPPYAFTYNTDVQLPPKDSYQQDFWGYYNGATTNVGLLPDLDFFDFNNDMEFRDFFPGRNIWQYNYVKNNRYTDNSKVGACMLKQIKYPTGGYTDFTFEPNAFTNQFIPNQQQFSTMRVITSRLKGWGACGLGQCVYGPFSLAKSTTISLDISFRHGSPHTTGQPVNTDVISRVYNNSYVRILKNNVEIKRWIPSDFIPPNSNLGIGVQYFTNVPNGVLGDIVNFRIEYQAGAQYKIEVFFPDPCSSGMNSATCIVNPSQYWPNQYTQGTGVDIRFYNVLNADISTSYQAGLRIKNIKNYSASGILEDHKEILYINEDGTSSGKILNRFHPLRSIDSFCTMCGNTANGISGNIMQPFKQILVSADDFGTGGGPVVGYSRVVEIQHSTIDTTTLGKKIFSYHNNENWTRKGFFNVINPLNGKIKAEESKDTSGKMLVEKLFTYQEQIPPTSFDAIQIVNHTYGGGDTSDGDPTNVDNEPYKYSFETTPLDAHWYKPKTVTTNTYIEGDPSQKVTQAETYEYEPLYKNLRNLITTNSAGEQLKSTFYYPPDSWEQEVLDDGTLFYRLSGVPIVNEQYRGSSLLSRQITGYIEIGEIGAVPSEVYFQKGGDGTVNERKVTSIYDIEGKLVQYTLENSTPVAIIWGYKREYPIAKIVGATYSQAGSYVSALQAASNNNTLSESSFLALRTALPDAMITTYTYKPLIGVSTITDARGYTTYYEYDSFGRLRFAREKDLEGNYRILSENEYHYKP